MNAWHPLSGEIPPDPPRAPWRVDNVDSPAEIIARMRDLWALRNGGSPKHAQDLFENAGQWLDYWRAARADSEALIRAGIFVNDHAQDQAAIDVVPEGAIAQTAILSIHAAHQAILTGRRDLWGLAIELSAAAQKSISDRAIPARAAAKEKLNAANSDRSSVATGRNAEILEEARKLIDKGVKPSNLAPPLTRMKWRNAKNPESEELVHLSRNHIQAILKILKAEHPDVFRPTAAPQRPPRARKP